MPRLPSRFAAAIPTFAPLFLQRGRRHAEVLLTGAILAPGTRTVASVPRTTGLARERRSVNHHRVLSRAAWCPRAAARLLLGLLTAASVPAGLVALGIDDTIERRRGKRSAAKGVYRDPVRSSRGHFVKASGLRWLSRMLLAPVPWGGAHLGAAVPDGSRPFGAPLPTARAAAQEADGPGAAARVAGPPLAAQPQAGGRGRQQLRRPGTAGRVPLLCTDQACDPMQVLRWSVRRWQVEVTAKPEVRAGSARCATTSGSKRRGNGRAPPPHARRPACSACSPSSPCRQPNSGPGHAGPSQPAPGVASSARPSPTRWQPSAGKPRPALQDGITYAPCHAA